MDEIIIKPYWGLKVWIYSIFHSLFFIFMNLWQFLLPAGTRRKVASMHYELNSGKPIYFQEGSLGEILFFRHTELCYTPQAEQYKVKIKDLCCFGGSFKAKPFPTKRKENV